MPATDPKPALAVVPEAPREPTIEQRRAILAELDGAYDRSRGRYCGKETDSTVAKRVGGVPIAWVAQVREMMFGPSGENDEMDDLLAQIAIDRAAMETLSAQALKTASEAETIAKRLGDHAARLEALRKAVGPRGERV